MSKVFCLRASSLNRHPHDVLARVTDDTVSVFPPLYEVVECDERQSEAFVSRHALIDGHQTQIDLACYGKDSLFQESSFSQFKFD